MMIPTRPPAAVPDGADALFECCRLRARTWLVQVIAEVRQQHPALLPTLQNEDWEDLLQETETALWSAARRYARHGPAAVNGRCFMEFAQVQVRGVLKAYISHWWCDPDFQLLPDLEERPAESVFALGPDV